VAYAVLNKPRMNVSLYQAAAAMNAHARWQELISENLAAGSVPGYRKKEISFSAVAAGIDPTAIKSNGSTYVIPSAQTSINLQQGDLRATGNPMDFALHGPGFIEVQLPNGSRAYTRDGELHLDSSGQLVTKQGYTVLGYDGPMQFDLNNGGAITMAPTGEISQGGEVRGRVRMMEFSDPRQLTAIGSGYFLAENPNAQAAPATATSIQQGFLEASNTSPTAEMANLIVAMRMFESNQRVLQMQDERMGSVISQLGNPN
jgi:flagellar basal body rod protein FlgG